MLSHMPSCEIQLILSSWLKLILFRYVFFLLCFKLPLHLSLLSSMSLSLFLKLDVSLTLLSQLNLCLFFMVSL